MQNLEDKKYWIWFSLIRGLGSRRKQRLLEIYKTPKKIYNLTEQELTKINGRGKETIKNIVDENIKQYVEKHINYMQKNNIDIISIQ